MVIKNEQGEEITVFTQEELNSRVAQAGQDSTAALLKVVGAESEDALKATVAEAKRLADSQKTEAEKTAEALRTAQELAATAIADNLKLQNQIKSANLEQDAVSLGAELKVTPVKATQVLKLMGVDAASYDRATGKVALKAQMEAFLKEPDNAHFISTSAPVAGSANKPNSSNDGNKRGEFDDLLNMVTAVPRSSK